MTPRLSFALAALLCLARADVKFTSPAAGALISGTTIDIKWTDSGTGPHLGHLATYKIFLCAGGNDPNSISILAPITTKGDHSNGHSFQGVFDPELGGTTENAYFLKMISETNGGIVVNYSPRFSLSDMTGRFSVIVQNALQSVSGTEGPASHNQIVLMNRADAPAAGDFGVAYSLQSGPTRFAPMAKRPGTKITKNHQSAQYPTSAYTAWLQVSGPPNAQITVTQPDTYVISSMEATYAAAPMPSDSDLQKFLNRWRD